MFNKDVFLRECMKIMHEHNGDLVLRGNQMDELPDGLTVKGSLFLDGSAIKKLPAGLNIGEDLLSAIARLKNFPMG